MKLRSEYLPAVSAVEAAGYFVTAMPLDSGDDRIVCAGQRRDGGGFTGNSFWLAERNGDWFLGAWCGRLYRLLGADAASEIAIAWLRLNFSRTDWDVPGELKLQYNLSETAHVEWKEYRVSMSPNWPVAVPLAILACAGLVLVVIPRGSASKRSPC
jgi:hypothetical protein